MQDTFNNIHQSFIDYLHSDAFFPDLWSNFVWQIALLIFVFVFGYIVNFTWNYRRVVRNSKWIIGNYYIFHAEIIPGIKDLIRVSKITIKLNILGHLICIQKDYFDGKTHFSGDVKIHSDVAFCFLKAHDLRSWKHIAFYDFPKSKTHNKITIGIMSGLNHQNELFSIPIIISNSYLSNAALRECLDNLSIKTINRSTCRTSVQKMESHAIDHPDQDLLSPFSA